MLLILFTLFRDIHSYSFCEEFLWLCFIALRQTENAEFEKQNFEEILENTSATNTNFSESFFEKPLKTTIDTEALRSVIVRLIHRWIDCIQIILVDHYRFGQTTVENETGVLDFILNFNFQILFWTQKRI